MGDEYWLVAAKNEGAPGEEAARATFEALRREMSGVADCHRFEIPELRVGTLEKLMAAGDLLNKVDLNVEAALRKIERTFEELKSGGLGENAKLGVNQEPAAKYVENFRWNAAKYPTQRSVDELIRNIVQSSAKTEHELKEASTAYQEKKQKVQALERQREGNLTVANLDEVLTPLIEPSQIHDSTYLRTIPILVQKAKEKDFMATYHKIGSDLVGYGPDDDRDAVRGSPVVPGSAVRVTQDKENLSLYLITILRKYYEDFKTAAQTATFLVRDYDYEASYETVKRLELEGDGVDQLTLAKQEAESAKYELQTWCQNHYGDAFIAWAHVKAIRVFVESVLRFGLPVNFCAATVKPSKKSNEKKAREKLAKLYARLDARGLMGAQPDEGNTNEELFPYVSYTIVPEHHADK